MEKNANIPYSAQASIIESLQPQAIRGGDPRVAHLDEASFLKEPIPEGGEQAEAVPTQDQFVDLRRSARGGLKGKKKGSKRRAHVNCKSGTAKATMGAMILNRLGSIQQKSHDQMKAELLKVLPMGELVEASVGVPLPDYQKRLMNLNQQRQQGLVGGNDEPRSED